MGLIGDSWREDGTMAGEVFEESVCIRFDASVGSLLVISSEQKSTYGILYHNVFFWNHITIIHNKYHTFPYSSVELTITSNVIPCCCPSPHNPIQQCIIPHLVAQLYPRTAHINPFFNSTLVKHQIHTSLHFQKHITEHAIPNTEWITYQATHATQNLALTNVLTMPVTFFHYWFSRKTRNLIDQTSICFSYIILSWLYRLIEAKNKNNW